jgi:Ca2+-binding RTX toxin-like protein
MEGNEGTDTLHGQDGNDDMIGGTGRINTDPATGVDGRLDSGETMSGGPGFDWMTGDNGIVRRTLSGSGAWLQNTFNDGIQHERIQLLDVASLTNPAVPTDVSGGDTMAGNEHDDVMYGQGNGAGTPDTMNGNDGDDYMEGNAGGDVMEGNANQDDMIGGTGRINQDPAAGVNGRFDGDDQMSGDTGSAAGGDGGDDYDVMTGDNAVVERPLTPLPAGDWKVNTFNDGIERTITMLDLELASAPALDDRVHGNDTMFGNGDDDIMRGQGGNDTMHGNDGDDDMQGNHAVDTMFGDDHQDDMIGGSTVAGRRDDGDFMFGGPANDVMTGDNATITRPLTPLPAGDWVTQQYGHLVDTPDPSDDEFHDQVVSGSFTRIVRTVGMIDTNPAAAGPISGSDLVNGNAGDDELFGQFDDTDGTGIGDDANVPVLCDGVTPPTVDDPDGPGVDATPVPIEGDLLCGEAGEDAVMGDQATIVDVAETGSAATTVTHNGSPFIKEPVRPAGQLTRQVTLTQIAAGGDDVAVGGLDHDSIHMGAGNDLAQGGDYINPQGDQAWDIIFAGDGIDAAWGGPGHDHLWGGYEGDFLDVKPRTNTQFPPNGDPLAWFLFAPDDPDTVGDPSTPFGEGYDGYLGLDLIYGGWAQDAMQANEGGNGPVPGDRLVDWNGAYNAYYVCPPTFGEHISTRQLSPSLVNFLKALAEHDGATTVATGTRTTSSGFDELALVYSQDIQQNSNPPHPDTPEHFTCE